MLGTMGNATETGCPQSSQKQNRDTELAEAEYNKLDVKGSLAQRLMAGTHCPSPGVKISVPTPTHVNPRQGGTYSFVLMTRRGTLTYLMTVNLINSAASKILFMELISR